MRKLIKYLHKLSQLLPCISLEILICLKSYTKHSRVLKGNCLELRMHLSKIRLWQHARFSGHLSFTESALMSGVISFAAKDPSYAGRFALHRCRLESNLKSSGCLFQVKLLVTVSF